MEDFILFYMAILGFAIGFVFGVAYGSRKKREKNE